MTPPLSPECVLNKCGACPTDALDEETDKVVDCTHLCHVTTKWDESERRK